MTKVEERRQTVRQALFLNAKVRSATHLPFDAVISDITAHGCCVSAIARPDTLDVRVCIRPDGLEALSGIVRWVAGGRFGDRYCTRREAESLGMRKMVSRLCEANAAPKVCAARTAALAVAESSKRIAA